MSRKEEIIDAVVDILQTKGLQSDFTISELARKVDIGKSTIYEYFTTKNEILTQALQAIFKTTIDGISSRKIQSDLPFEEHLKDELHYIFNMAKESSKIIEFLTPEFTESVPSTIRGGFLEKMKKTANHYEAVFTAIIRKGVEEGILQTNNLPVKSMLVASLISGSVTRFSNSESTIIEQLDIDEYIDAMYQTIIKIFN